MVTGWANTAPLQRPEQAELSMKRLPGIVMLE
jgi:hypothetical protein